ncbi:MAG: phage tail tube protein [Candidatus Anstonellaceae archaeon]
MSQKDGRIILVKHGSNTFVGQIAGSVTLSRDAIEKTTKSSGRWKEFFPGEAGGSISVNGLVAISDTGNFTTLFNSWETSNVVTVVFEDPSLNDRIEAQGYVTSLQLNANKNEAQSYNLTIRLTGEINLINTP